MLCQYQTSVQIVRNKPPDYRAALGIEIFVLEAPKVDDLVAIQEDYGRVHVDLKVMDCRMIDRLANKIGSKNIKRYLPAQHHWPERSTDCSVNH